jgi:polysaccharide export outer membrane protein
MHGHTTGSGGRRGAALRRLVLAALAAVVAQTLACASAQPAPARTGETGGVGGPYRVGPPDQLVISVLPEPVIERVVVVRPDGKISIDLVGDVQAQGRSLEEIAKDVEERIARYKRDARVTVSLAASRSSTITVLGEVRGPSNFPLERETRVAEALGLVGGTTNFAASNRIRIVRSYGGQTTVHIVNLDAIMGGDLSTNYVLEEGDLIVVPRTVSAVIGFAIQNAIFPFQQILGFGATVVNTYYTGRNGGNNNNNGD